VINPYSLDILCN